MRGKRMMVAGAVALAATFGLATASSAQAAPIVGVATPDGSTATSTSSRVVVSWDGTTETIDLALGLTAGAGKVGLILPTPSKATVTASDPTLFTDVERATAPIEHREDDWWGRTAPTVAPAAAVAQTPLGTVTPTAIRATNRGGLSKWLKANGLTLTDADRAQVADYGSDGWSLNLVAVDSASAVDGELAPVRLSFAAKQPVLPIRLASTGKTATSIRIYALGQHRSNLRVAGTSRNPNASQSVLWAGPSTPRLHDLGAYLTVIDVTFASPETQVTGDLGLVDAQADDPLIPSTVVYSPIRLLGFPLGWLIVIWGGIGAVLAVAYLVNRFRSQ